MTLTEGHRFTTLFTAALLLFSSPPTTNASLDVRDVRGVANVTTCTAEGDSDHYSLARGRLDQMQAQYGWDVGTDEMEVACNMERVHVSTLDQETFRKLYLERVPVVLTGLYDENTRFREMCSKDSLLADWGDANITLSTANSYSHKKKYLPLRRYIAEQMLPQKEDASGFDTLYHFGDNDHKGWDGLFQHYRLPPFIPPGSSTALSWGLAGPRTGVPFHIHGAGYSEPIHGRKTWFLTPPDQRPTFDPEETTLTWMKKHYATVAQTPGFLQCTLYPGDALYFPSKWWHATFNLDESVFISTFVNYPSPGQPPESTKQMDDLLGNTSDDDYGSDEFYDEEEAEEEEFSVI
mmetsp:Transcript_40040/g.67150  ORF Transcript_40040/g.67150 Transcript_40040/m.67150 type:complete len:350 (-) Transcript_40040:276-1325(-)|eukprot:CAMPEP_0198205040 /NCGR_PEP_ID=MMETSP1445-20131203/8520_1 /TAXON_ID=36898 /ORGANISM="Pyramimonas sp., Strain CCMP2087" /LENGTH=349 /DNA_ID=CAMNT_0043877181 /DNA_START=105 /DNA_END=1154 /DNA_ORIENTATION=-